MPRKMNGGIRNRLSTGILYLKVERRLLHDTHGIAAREDRDHRQSHELGCLLVEPIYQWLRVHPDFHHRHRQANRTKWQ